MSLHADAIRLQLASGPLAARQLAESIGTSQPTISRALATLGVEVVRIGRARSIQYALRDTVRGLPDIAIFRVDAEGRIRRLGALIPVRPGGFVMHQADGVLLHSHGIPWWLFDMRPQGYLGRAYAARHATELGLPARLADWSDTDALRALIAHGHDVVGNLLLGEAARDRFLNAQRPDPVEMDEYVHLAQQAVRGELPGSSAGGEQPKFTAYAATPEGAQHVIVKFSEPEAGPVSERWRDMLLAEHMALETLNTAGIAAARSRILDVDAQRFLELARFDRVGALGRCALHSLAALDAEFVGATENGWAGIARSLADAGVIRPEAAEGAALLWAFGTLIGNTDMHAGNLSFVAEHGRRFELSPAYDMTPMAFRPTAGGALVDTLNAAVISADVDNDTWRRALDLARAFVERVAAERRFSRRFSPCITALAAHLAAAGEKIGRLG